MILREVLVFPQILSSTRVARLNPFAQLFYRNLMHVCDGGGVFENDPKLLCSALYPRALDRVKPKAVVTWLMECQAAGLIRFYTDEKGRSLGEFMDWLQKDLKRRRRFATREQTPGELPLFGGGAPPPRVPNGIEGKSPQPPAAAGGRIASLSSLTDSKTTTRRGRRLPKLVDLHEEKKRIDTEIQEIFRPGGCAYNILPTGDKKVRADKLIAESNQLAATIKNVRAAHAKETAA